MNIAMRNELARALRNRQFVDIGDGRFMLPRQGLFVGGVFSTDINGQGRRILPNLWTTEGLTDLLSCYFAHGATPTGFYLAPFSGNVDPDATITGANFTARQTEFTNYSEATRVAWTPGDITSPSVDNSSAVASFTNTLAGATIWGFGLLTNQVKSATTGKCLAVFKDSDPRDNLRVGDKINLQYTITAQDAS